MDLVPGQADPLTSRAMAALSLAAGNRFMQQQSTQWQLQWTDYAADPGSTYRLTEATRWWPLDGAQAVHFSGRLIGGCIDTLMHTAGTPYGDVHSFIAAHAGDAGTVLYLENAEQSPTALVRALHRLHWAGWLDGIAGLLVGRSAARDSSDPLQLRYVDALRSTLSDLPCPVLLDVDIGHRPPQMVLINGAIAEVKWTAALGGQVEQSLA
jgi:muramoyltetrapeptide carboxypeptidase LdcA involved in peptidoglycan recycling